MRREGRGWRGRSKLNETKSDILLQYIKYTIKIYYDILLPFIAGIVHVGVLIEHCNGVPTPINDINWLSVLRHI